MCSFLGTNPELTVHVKHLVSPPDMPVAHTDGHMPHFQSDSIWTQLPAIGSKSIPEIYLVELFIISVGYSLGHVKLINMYCHRGFTETFTLILLII